jgi:hypothetical protein
MDPRVREDDGAAVSDSDGDSDGDSVDSCTTRKAVILAKAGIQFLRAVLAPTEITLPLLFDLQQYHCLPSDLA